MALGFHAVVTLPLCWRRSWGGFKRTSQHFPDFEEVVLSSRRVRKGPGRRPLSVKRQRFMELRARGWSIRGAAREVGISRSSAANWTRGYTVYRDGVAVRFVEPLDRLEVREISARYLSQQERIEIADLHHEGVGVREISRRLGRWQSTISRELKRNRTDGGRRPGYRPFEAHRRACARRARRRDRRIETNHDLGRVVAELLGQRWSPTQISRQLRKRFPEEPAMWLSHESIYQAVYEPGSPLMRPTRLAPQRRSPLRTGRVITAALSSARTAAGHGLNSQCSRSTNVLRAWKVAQRPAIGRAT